jgi:glutamyl-tRNA synthetase
MSAVSVTGRFAPSPTGPLHLGNLRTALVAWLSARSQGGRFVVRVEDLDPACARLGHERGQLDDLAAIGLDWDGEVVRQSERYAHYEAALERLDAAGLLYPCFCSRREVREAVAAPHGLVPEGFYPGTCRDLDEAERAARWAAGRHPALRLLGGGEQIVVDDVLAGRVEGVVDDLVLRRNDGVPAYNLAVVVDDAAQGVTEVVRGDDLLAGTPRQVHLQRLLGLETPRYLHVPLVVGADGSRLAKRHGAVTLAALAAEGVRPGEVLALLGASLGLAHPGERVRAGDLVARFDPAALPRDPWVLPEAPACHR